MTFPNHFQNHELAVAKLFVSTLGYKEDWKKEKEDVTGKGFPIPSGLQALIVAKLYTVW